MRRSAVRRVRGQPDLCFQWTLAGLVGADAELLAEADRLLTIA